MRRSSHESSSSARTPFNLDSPHLFQFSLALIEEVLMQSPSESRSEEETTQTTEGPSQTTPLSSSASFNTFPRISKVTPRTHSKIVRLTEDEIKERYGADPVHLEKRVLHCCLNEFSSVLENWEKTINCLAFDLPKYLAELGNKKGVNLLSPDNGIEHIVLRISKQLLGIIPMLQPFFDGFRNVFAEWDSSSPNLSDAILSEVDRLRCVTLFLNNTRNFYIEFKNRREVDKRFGKALAKFEENPSNEVKEKEKKKKKDKKKGKEEGEPTPPRTEEKIIAVFQGVPRVQLMMVDYLKYLKTESEEKEKAKRAVEKVKEIISLSNSRIQEVCLEDLKVMQKHFNGFDVFAHNRRLVYEQRAIMKLGEESSFRYAVLFSDCLWLLTSKKGKHHLENDGKDFTLGRDIEGAEQFPIGDLDIGNCSFDKQHLKIVTKEKNFTIHFKQLEFHEKFYECMKKAQKTITEHQIRIPKSCAKHDSSIREMRRASTIATTHNRDATFGESSSQSVSEFGFKDIVWTAEYRSNLASDYCMMVSCNKKLGEEGEKNRCLSCGWFICQKCSGEAPVEANDYQTGLVCPDCFNKIKMRNDNGLLFPDNHPSRSSSSGGVQSDREGLFKRPLNADLQKTDAEKHMKTSEISGRAKLKNCQMSSIKLTDNKDNKKIAGFAVFRPADKRLNFFENKDLKECLGGWWLRSEEFKEIQQKNGVLFEFEIKEEGMTVRLKVPNSDSEKWRTKFMWLFTKSA